MSDLILAISMAELERMIGATWNPPPKGKPAQRALYLAWVCSKIPENVLTPMFLLAGVAPIEFWDLEKETIGLRTGMSDKKLQRIASAECE